MRDTIVPRAWCLRVRLNAYVLHGDKCSVMYMFRVFPKCKKKIKTQIKSAFQDARNWVLLPSVVARHASQNPGIKTRPPWQRRCFSWTLNCELNCELKCELKCAWKRASATKPQGDGWSELASTRSILLCRQNAMKRRHLNPVHLKMQSIKLFKFPKCKWKNANSTTPLLIVRSPKRLF